MLCGRAFVLNPPPLSAAPSAHLQHVSLSAMPIQALFTRAIPLLTYIE